jgi:hypothetical protein
VAGAAVGVVGAPQAVNTSVSTILATMNLDLSIFSSPNNSVFSLV